jgi:hypothetical protein
MHYKKLILAALVSAFSSNSALAVCSISYVYGDSMQASSTTWKYNFTINAGSCPGYYVTDFYLPYFSDAGIDNITLPGAGKTFSYENLDTQSTERAIWSYSIEPGNNIFNLTGAGAIRFHVSFSPDTSGRVLPGIRYGSTDGTDGFGFTANYGEVKGPYALQENKNTYDVETNTYTSLGQRVLFGDPPIPGSPDTIAALNPVSSVPEVNTTSLLVGGLFLMGALLRRRT